MTPDTLLAHYLALVQASPQSTDDDLVRHLIDLGASPPDAWMIAQVAPVAFCRRAMATSGVTFGTRYVILDERGEVAGGGPLSELPFFAVAAARALALLDSELLWAVARRSPEARVVEMAQRDGASADAIRVGDVTFMDPRVFTGPATAADDPAAGAAIIYCEVCNLPHRRGVAICEDCEHVMGRPPDWLAVRGRRDSRARHAAAALTLVVVMLAMNVWAFGGAGYLVVLAPLVWLTTSAYRYRVLAKSLARHESPQAIAELAPSVLTRDTRLRGRRLIAWVGALVALVLALVLLLLNS